MVLCEIMAGLSSVDNEKHLGNTAAMRLVSAVSNAKDAYERHPIVLRAIGTLESKTELMEFATGYFEIMKERYAKMVPAASGTMLLKLAAEDLSMHVDNYIGEAASAALPLLGADRLKQWKIAIQAVELVEGYKTSSRNFGVVTLDKFWSIAAALVSERELRR